MACSGYGICECHCCTRKILIKKIQTHTHSPKSSCQKKIPRILCGSRNEAQVTKHALRPSSNVFTCYGGTKHHRAPIKDSHFPLGVVAEAKKNSQGSRSNTRDVAICRKKEKFPSAHPILFTASARKAGNGRKKIGGRRR